LQQQQHTKQQATLTAATFNRKASCQGTTCTDLAPLQLLLLLLVVEQHEPSICSAQALSLLCKIPSALQHHIAQLRLVNGCANALL
jgi:hypothetical protein